MRPAYKLFTLAGLCLIGQIAASIVVGLAHGWIAGITTAVVLHFALGYAMRPWACRWYAEWVAAETKAMEEMVKSLSRLHSKEQ